MGLSNELSCEAGSFPCCCRLNPTGVFNQWFEALFPLAGTLGCVVCFAPPLFLSPFVPPGLSVHECGTTVSTSHCLEGSASCSLPASCSLDHPALQLPSLWVLQPPPCHKSSLPGCASPPLLPVWMNVSSLSPWLSDFHAV